MSSVQQLITDYTALSVECKRRFPEIRQNCDRIIVDLKKSYSGSSNIREITNTELAAPLISSCKTANAKIVTISIPIIQRLIAAQLIPSSRLPDLLEGLREASNLAIDIQLRILQCLPTLNQYYKDDISGDLVILLLGICSNLTSNNKSTVVINTASATLQQLFSNVFDKISPAAKGDEITIKIDNNETVKVDKFTSEGFNIFQDLCYLVENEKPMFFTENISIKPISVLEIIENIISSHKETFLQHQELAYLLRIKLVPSLLRILNASQKSYTLFTRTMRILYVLLSSQLTNLILEGEIILSFLNHILLNNEPGGEGDTHWEKIMVLELYKNLFTNFGTIEAMFQNYDANPKKKNVVQELFSILITFLQHNSYLLNDMVKPLPSGTLTNGDSAASSQLYLSKSTSAMKITLLDHLDKTEPPHFVPSTYPVYIVLTILLSCAEGIANFVLNLSNTSDPTTLESDVEFTNLFIEANYRDISVLYENFIYMLMDNDSFHLLIRSLQRFTHTTGLLGLETLRDGLLLILSQSITKNVIGTSNLIQSPNPNNYQEPGSQLLALGESLVESFTSYSTDSTTHEPATRNFNSRHITCLRALINLAVSLGSTLQHSWDIIWITFQWSDFYLHGAEDHKQEKTFNEEKHPNLTSQDYGNIENSKRKLFDSIRDYPPESYDELVQSLIALSNVLFRLSDKEKVQLPICGYNKAYFLKNLLNVAKIDPVKFLIEHEKSWNMITDYFVSLGINRDFNYNLRLQTVGTFNDITKYIAEQGFQSDQTALTAKKSLDGLNQFLDAFFKLGIPSELLVLNCETEIHLLVLTTLHQLIDKYDTHYQNSWNVVFKILNSSFKNNGTFNQDNNLKEKIRLLIDSSFDTLKLILDEFMSSLPFDQMKLLIDTLSNFCSQGYDLNISFSSVSYFWLISDSIKSRIGLVETKTPIKELSSIKDEASIIKYFDSDNKESRLFYIVLETYLLKSIVSLSFDSRAQVRDGSIQTFFQIIEVYGPILSAVGGWQLIYDVVLPHLFKLKIDLKDSQYHKKEWLESLELILSGFVTIFNKFMVDFDYDKWERLIKYFQEILQFKWVDLNLKVFKAFHDLLSPLNANVDKKIRLLLFEFWSSVPVEYDFINPTYQDSIAALVECFPPLYEIFSKDFSAEECSTVISLLNKCARYPVLPDNHLDDVKPSKLQKAVISNLKIIKSDDSQVQSQVIQQLSNIAVYPFETRTRIEQKLNQSPEIVKRFKIPSFTAVGHEAVLIIAAKLKELNDYQLLLEDRGLAKILKSLLEIMQNETKGIAKEQYRQLWIEADEIFANIVDKIVTEEWDLDLWNLIIGGIKICFTTGDEQISKAQYEKLILIVLPKLLQSSNGDLIEDFILELYNNSFLYEFDDLDEIHKTNGDNKLVIATICLFNFEDSFGTTKPLMKYDNQLIRFNCLQELIRFSQAPENVQLASISQKYLLSRIAFSLRRFISDVRLLSRCPVTRVQEREVMTLLQGLNGVGKVSTDNEESYKSLYKLFIKVGSSSTRVRGLGSVLEEALAHFE